jgi:hypothetical protein
MSAGFSLGGFAMDDAPSSLHLDIEPELLRRLGRIVSHWAYVEQLEASLLAFLTNAHPGLIFVVTSNVSGSTLTGWLRTLAAIRFNEPDKKRLEELLSDIDEVRGQRNAYVHGLWIPGPEPETAVVTTIRWERAEVMKHELVTGADLNGLHEEIEQIYRRLVATAHHLGFHKLPSAKGTT